MNKPQAAVIGAGLMSFSSGLTPGQQASVKLAALIAERDTRDALDNHLIQDWYSYYKRKLMFYGWDALPASEVHWPGQERPDIVDSALRTISATAGSEYATTMGLAMARLKLAPAALAHFEQRTKDTGVFQLLPCLPARNGCIDMVLYHETLARVDVTAGFLYRQRRQLTVKAELVRFNTRLFDQKFRQRVEANLQAVALREIHQLVL
ncbi:hypothetical protein D3C77_22400 [compost metagenome]|uniref:hypothetical protein n=1 Tax=Pseudomonas TaxID=286 RepID=UPI00041E1959|nr:MULTISPECIES: hypothetical protein [Pseudomonas]MCW2268374.1 hypothetical protein [Pseudomonas sp. JUb96]PRA60474.1 hypothetical protein CQ065_20500 [Pseudomonas sp. MYb187]